MKTNWKRFLMLLFVLNLEIEWNTGKGILFFFQIIPH